MYLWESREQNLKRGVYKPRSEDEKMCERELHGGIRELHGLREWHSTLTRGDNKGWSAFPLLIPTRLCALPFSSVVGRRQRRLTAAAPPATPWWTRA